MKTTYSTLFSLTELGLDLFQKFMRGEIAGGAIDPQDEQLATPRLEFGQLVVEEFDTARAMAKAIKSAFGDRNPQDFAGDTGLWSWLTLVLVDQVFPLQGGVRKPKEFYRWFPAAPSDWRKAQRHLVRMPTLLYAAFASDADHLLCGKPSVGPDIREQLTSQQDMFSRNFQQVCRTLYYDEATDTVKRGSGSKEGPGIPRRLASIRQQLDVTWDMTDLSADRILDLLPAEFDAFRTVP